MLRLRCRGRRRAGRLLARAAAGAALAMFAELLLALQFFVEADGLILDDGVGNFQAPLEFLDQVALRALHDHVDEKAFAVFRHAVGQAPRAPLLGFLDLAAVLPAECSSVATILLISSSGVAGRQMKIRSYRRSSMFL